MLLVSAYLQLSAYTCTQLAWERNLEEVEIVLEQSGVAIRRDLR